MAARCLVCAAPCFSTSVVRSPFSVVPCSYFRNRRNSVWSSRICISGSSVHKDALCESTNFGFLNCGFKVHSESLIRETNQRRHLNLRLGSLVFKFCPSTRLSVCNRQTSTWFRKDFSKERRNLKWDRKENRRPLILGLLISSLITDGFLFAFSSSHSP